MKILKKIGYIVILAFLGVALVWILRSEKMVKDEYIESVIAARERIQVYDDERKELEKQIEDKEYEYQERMKKKSCVVLYFEQASANLIEEIYPLMEEYGYRGVFLLDDQSKLGTKGYLTKKEYQKLLDAGWQVVTTQEKSTYVKKLKLNSERIKEEETLVKQALIDSIDAQKSQLVVARYVGEAMEDEKKDCSQERYVNLLNWLQENQDYVEVETFNHVDSYYDAIEETEEEYLNEWKLEKEKIEERIQELEELIRNGEIH